MAEIIQINENTWRFEDGFVRFFLLAGKEKAAMIDSGVNSKDALEQAKKLTDKSIMLLNTHGDGDHTSGTAGFDKIYMHKADHENCHVKERYPETVLEPVTDGDCIDLGDRLLKIIHIPGHTYGSIAILDVKNRVLIAGDSVQTGHIYMFGDKRDPDSFEASLDKLIRMKDSFDVIYSSHDDFLLPADHIDAVKAAWKKARSGEVDYTMTDLFGNLVKTYSLDACGFYMD